ncbi:hypothetical protein [Streptomyces sp. NBC_01439]|uniref:hypothetical protein n=1 Tax=Streptomyces sp. NBC_01439 TaxID=2903867 RepID=UPI002E2DC4FF|nr:hypothetical protein [Streptomyces sp. NBC_01439]
MRPSPSPTSLKARPGGEEWELSRLRGPLLAASGRLDDALALAHPEGASPYAKKDLAHLLIDAGRPEEAVTLLETDRLDHRRTLGPLLVELGRVAEAVTLLRTPSPHVPPPEPSGYSDCPPF